MPPTVCNDEVRIRLKAKQDKHGKTIFVGVTSMPAQIDLQDTLFVFFPDKDNRGGDLVARYYTGRGKDTEEPCDD